MYVKGTLTVNEDCLRETLRCPNCLSTEVVTRGQIYVRSLHRSIYRYKCKNCGIMFRETTRYKAVENEN